MVNLSTSDISLSIAERYQIIDAIAMLWFLLSWNFPFRLWMFPYRGMRWICEAFLYIRIPPEAIPNPRPGSYLHGKMKPSALFRVPGMTLTVGQRKKVTVVTFFLCPTVTGCGFRDTDTAQERCGTDDGCVGWGPCRPGPPFTNMV